MCKEDDSHDLVINTCNGYYCDSFAPYKPTIWTEAWSGCSLSSGGQCTVNQFRIWFGFFAYSNTEEATRAVRFN
ncbi:Beta-galactosidase 3 [Cardamine amara subsp. amara]|uniref:Beta-galactosidase 3 n=1 Tax=Cardamine amara subsp. amara TaxID=228776 RepID=A0ABD0ZMW5_CARAN